MKALSVSKQTVTVVTCHLGSLSDALGSLLGFYDIPELACFAFFPFIVCCLFPLFVCALCLRAFILCASMHLWVPALQGPIRRWCRRCKAPSVIGAGAARCAVCGWCWCRFAAPSVVGGGDARRRTSVVGGGVARRHLWLVLVSPFVWLVVAPQGAVCV